MRWRRFGKQVATTAAVLRDGQNWNCRSQNWSRGYRPAQCRGPRAGGCPSAGHQGPARARVRAHGGVAARREAAEIFQQGNTAVADASNSVFLGTAVQTGIGTAVIVRTGKDTAFGEIAQRLATRPPETEFGRGIRHFGLMITRVIMLLVLFVLLVNIVFAPSGAGIVPVLVALAVGMTPEMMPMIITITLAQGARRMTEEESPGQATCGNRRLRQHRDSLQR